MLTVLHDQLDQLTAGSITRDVTFLMNLIGLVSIGLIWLDLAIEAPKRKSKFTFGLLALLSFISIIQIGLLWGHSYLAHWIDERGLRGFYRVHTIYLNTSTVQWGACILLMLALVYHWTKIDQIRQNQPSDQAPA